MSNTIFLIVGESGSGKTTLVSSLEKQHNLTSIESYTTRPKRSNDEYGHIFITEDEFDNLQNLVGYTKYNGCRYCATSQQVDECDLYVIDPSGVDFFKVNYRGNKKVKVIYIKSSISTRMERMMDRGERVSSAIERIINDVNWFKDMEDKADFIVENNLNTKFQDVAISAWGYIRKERNSD